MAEHQSESKQPRQWFVRRESKEHGPFTSKQLRALAIGGKITSSDFIRKADSQKWVEAGTLKGLFPNEPQERTPDTTDQTVPSLPPQGEGKKSNVARNIAFGCAGAFVLFFLACTGMLRLLSDARTRLNHTAEQSPPAPSFARLAGRWKSSTGQIYELRITKSDADECRYEDVAVRPENGIYPTFTFNKENGFTLITGWLQVFGNYELVSDDEIRITGKAIITKQDLTDVEEPVDDRWTRLESARVAENSAPIEIPREGPNGEQLLLDGESREADSMFEYYLDKSGQKVMHGLARSPVYGGGSGKGRSESVYDSGSLLRQTETDGSGRIIETLERIEDGNYIRQEFEHPSDTIEIGRKSLVKRTVQDGRTTVELLQELDASIKINGHEIEASSREYKIGMANGLNMALEHGRTLEARKQDGGKTYLAARESIQRTALSTLGRYRRTVRDQLAAGNEPSELQGIVAGLEYGYSMIGLEIH